MHKYLLSCILLLSILYQAYGQKYSPGPFEFPKPLYQKPDTTTLVFLGDVMMHREQISNAFRDSAGTYDFSTYFTNVRSLVGSADVAVANMEFTLAGKPYTGYPCFSAPDGYPEYVRESGVDIFLAANNHILDKGRKGIERTMAIYGRMEKNGGIRYTGIALNAKEDSLRNPLIILANGIRIALINFTYGTNVKGDGGYPKVHLTDTAEIAAAIGKAKASKADYIIALPHWGTEYVLRHNQAQARLAEWLAGKGCDAVIGSHPHVVQDISFIEAASKHGIGTRKVPVIYSMGNAVSNMSAPDTQIGMIVSIRIAVDKMGDRNMLEPGLTLTWCTRPGTLTGSYATIPVKAFAGHRDRWTRPEDYDNMLSTYRKVKTATGIKD